METIDKKLSPKVSTQNIQKSSQGVPLKVEKVLQVGFGDLINSREGPRPPKSKIERIDPLEKTISDRMEKVLSFDSALERRYFGPKFLGVQKRSKIH